MLGVVEVLVQERRPPLADHAGAEELVYTAPLLFLDEDLMLLTLWSGVKMSVPSARPPREQAT